MDEGRKRVLLIAAAILAARKLARTGSYTCRARGVVVNNASLPPTFRLGVFELSPQSGEPRKKGLKISLQLQPVEILAMLLERPGELVTPEELQEKLWPADTFVDFEQGLNNAIKRLRAALDDDAETPGHIETLPHRGYRFIGAVEGAKQFPPTKARPTRGARAPLPFAALAALLIFAAVVLVGLNVHGWRGRLFVSAETADSGACSASTV